MIALNIKNYLNFNFAEIIIIDFIK